MADKTPIEHINYEYIKCQNKNAETVILVHGIGLDMTIWDDIMPLLTTQFHVLRYDLPGHGKSYKDLGNSNSWKFLLTNFEKLLKVLSISKGHFVGHAGGGNFGIEVALHLKQTVQSLTVVSTPIFAPKEIGKQELENRLKFRNSTIEEITSSLIPNLCYPASEEKLELLRSIYYQISLPTYIDYIQLVGKTLLNYALDSIQQIETPMMMLIGEYDVLYPPQLQMLNMGYMPNIRFIIVPDAANMIMMDQPETFMRVFMQFIARINNNVAQVPYKYAYSKPLNEELHAIIDSGIQQVDATNSIKINMVDRFSVIINGKEVAGKWNQRKAKQIVTYIALHKNVTREKLFDTFWPEHDMEKARNYLRVSLNHIKGIIEMHTGENLEGYLTINRDSIEMKAQVKLDLKTLIDEMGSLEHGPLKIAIVLDRLKALPDTMFPSFYDDWIIELRTSIEDKIINVCEGFLDEDISDEQAIEVLKILLKYNPGEDLYYEQLISLLRKAEKDKEVHYFEKKRVVQQLEF